MKLPIAAVLIALVAACYDPVHQDDVASLGDEAPGVPEGPLHRPGQHCTTCHGGDGPGSPELSVAGTIYSVKGQPQPEVGARVMLTDHVGTQLVLVTNSAGNFFVDKATWDPIFPISVQVAAASGQPTAIMKSTIGRDGGCGSCHRGVGNRYYMPQIYLTVPTQ